MDKDYDIEALYAACEDRQVRPIMPLRLTPAVKAGADAALRTRPLAVRRIGLQPEGFQVALPDGEASPPHGRSRPAVFTRWPRVIRTLACALARARAVPLAA
jgi:hypothetical protein